MGKQELKRKETAVVSPNGEGKQYEQTLTVDDTCLPSAEELTAYQAIDPNIVTFLMDVSKKEQEHRHKMERDKLRVVDKNERRVFRVNWWGMFFAFLSIVVLVGLSGYALYLDSLGLQEYWEQEHLCQSFPFSLKTTKPILQKSNYLKIRRCVKILPFFFYAQSPDFHKLGLCYNLKILYL